MTRAFDDEWADCHGHGRARFLARAGMGLVASALLYRIDHWRLPTWGPDLRLDLRLAARSLLRRRRFVGVVVLTLTVGVGLNTAVFSLVNGLLVRPLPYLDAHELVQLSETAPGIETMDVSLPDFAVWRASSQVFTGMFAFDDESFLLAGSGRPEIVEGARVTPGFLDVLGLMPTLGRRFMAAEERPGAERVALISDALWERRFGRDPAVIGRSLVLDGVTHEVVGVVPANFHFPEVAQVWVPLAFHATEADPDEYGYDVIARLRPDRDLEAARQEGVRVASVLAERFPETKGNIGAIAYPIRMADIPAVVGGTALLLLAAVSLVLLVACTNAATLLMARGDARRGEMAVRRALGADGSRLFRQVMTETSVIALLGVAGALVAAHVLVDLLPALLPGERPFWVRFDLDHRVFLWTAAMGVVAVLVMGLPPVLQALRGEGAGRATRHATPPPGRRWLVGMQIAMATTLVAGAALSTRALLNLNRRSVGLNDAGVLVLAAPIPPWRYPDHGSRTRLTRSALESVRQLPGVTSAATVGSVPFLDGGGEAPMEGEGAAVPFPRSES